MVAERSVAQPRHPFGRVHPQDVLVRRRRGLYEILGSGEARSQEAVAHPAVFLGGKDVLAQVQVVPLGINQREREHGIRSGPIVTP